MLKINADDLPRFMACNGSRLMQPAIPKIADDPSARDEGTAAHYMASAVFNGAHTLDELVDRKAPNGVFMTADMAEHVGAYLSAIVMPAFFTAVELDTSKQTDAWHVPARVDFIAHTANNVLRVVDFKYGWRIVEPDNNWTLIFHAMSFCIWKGVAPERIDIQIYQPRPHHRDGALRTWPITWPQLCELFGQLDNTLRKPSDLLHTSNHCGKCPALVHCPAARLAEMNCVDVADTVFTDTIDNALLSHNLDNLNRAEAMIKARKEAFEELAKHRLRAGQVIDNYSVEMGLGNRAWKEGTTADMLNALTGKDLATPKLVTPKEAERRGVNEAVIAAMTYRPQTGLKLSRVKASKKAEKLFGKVT